MDPAAELLARLRLEVGRFRASQRRRVFDTAIQVGSIAAERVAVTIPARQAGQVDRQVRVDLFSALLEEAAADATHAWTARPGPAELLPEDIAWMVGAEAAFGAAGRTLEGCYAITRYGWVDVRTGERRVWKRLRLR